MKWLSPTHRKHPMSFLLLESSQLEERNTGPLTSCQVTLRMRFPKNSWKSEHQHQFQVLVESIEDYGILLLEIQGPVFTWAKSAERIKGYDFERGWLIRAIEAVQLLGAKAILAGISAVVPDTFVAIGAGFSPIKTESVTAARLPAFFR